MSLNFPKIFKIIFEYLNLLTFSVYAEFDLHVNERTVAESPRLLQDLEHQDSGLPHVVHLILTWREWEKNLIRFHVENMRRFVGVPSRVVQGTRLKFQSVVWGRAK